MRWLDVLCDDFIVSQDPAANFRRYAGLIIFQPTEREYFFLKFYCVLGLIVRVKFTKWKNLSPVGTLFKLDVNVNSGGKSLLWSSQSLPSTITLSILKYTQEKFNSVIQEIGGEGGGKGSLKFWPSRFQYWKNTLEKIVDNFT